MRPVVVALGQASTASPPIPPTGPPRPLPPRPAAMSALVAAAWASTQDALSACWFALPPPLRVVVFGVGVAAPLSLALHLLTMAAFAERRRREEKKAERSQQQRNKCEDHQHAAGDDAPPRRARRARNDAASTPADGAPHASQQPPTVPKVAVPQPAGPVAHRDKTNRGSATCSPSSPASSCGVAAPSASVATTWMHGQRAQLTDSGVIVF